MIEKFTDFRAFFDFFDFVLQFFFYSCLIEVLQEEFNKISLINCLKTKNFERSFLKKFEMDIQKNQTEHFQKNAPANWQMFAINHARSSNLTFVNTFKSE